MSNQIHAVIIGGGIQGATLAGSLAATGLFGVSIVEREHIGAGTTATNHGRIHIGTWNNAKNSDGIVQRSLLSKQLWEQFPNAISSEKPGLYCIETESSIGSFFDFCTRQRIPFQVIPNSHIWPGWIRTERYSAIVEIPEHSFNPARLAARFTQYALETGNCSLILGKVKRITCQGDKFLIHHENNLIISADIVINMMGRWCNDIDSDLDLPKVNIKWLRWRLLALQGAKLLLPPLDRVITIEGCDHKPLGALPHGSYVVFGCDVPADTLDLPEDLPKESIWRPFDPTHPVEQLLVDRHAPHFPVLQELRVLNQALYSFSGVYPELCSVSTESRCSDDRTLYSARKVYENPDIPHYFLSFGGNATTAILDSLELTEHLIARYTETKLNRSEILTKLVSGLPKKQLGHGMIWESWENSLPIETLPSRIVA